MFLSNCGSLKTIGWTLQDGIDKHIYTILLLQDFQYKRSSMNLRRMLTQPVNILLRFILDRLYCFAKKKKKNCNSCSEVPKKHASYENIHIFLIMATRFEMCQGTGPIELKDPDWHCAGGTPPVRTELVLYYSYCLKNIIHQTSDTTKVY